MDIDNLKAYVFRATDYGETSKILTLFSENKGLITVMAKGVKNPKSKKYNLVSQFCEASFDLTKKNNFFFLKDGIIINSNFHIRKSIVKIYLVQMIFDIIERTIVLNEENDNIYKLLHKTIIYIEKTENMIRLINMFLIKYISMIGFRPHLEKCVKCGKNIIREAYFSVTKGGVICYEDKKNQDFFLTNHEYLYFKKLLMEVYENINDFYLEIDEKYIFKIIISFIIYNTDISMPQAYKNFVKFMGIE